MPFFDRFTPEVRYALVLAQDEARGLGHNYLGTEHVLLGLLLERGGLAARVLAALAVEASAVRADVRRLIGQGADDAAGPLPFTPRVKTAFEVAIRDGTRDHRRQIGTEYVLLALAGTAESVAARILVASGASDAAIRETLAAEVRLQRRG